MSPETDPDPLRLIPTQHVPDTRADIGSALRAARLRRGHSIEAVLQHTRIPKKFIEALENNRFDDFPALAYLRGFLKSYCDYLELDFDPLWQALLQASQANAPAKPAETAPAKTHPEAARGEAHPKGEESPPGASPNGDSSAPFVLFGAVVLALALGFWITRPRQAPEGETAPAPPPAIAALRAEPSLVIEFREEVFLSLSLDGTPKFEGLVPKNSRQEWKARKTVTLSTTNPRALKLALNGAPYALPAPDSSGNYTIESP